MLVQDDLHVFDLLTSTWKRIYPKGNPPSPRYAHTATAIGKRIIIFGGFNGSNYLDDVFILDTGNFSIYGLEFQSYLCFRISIIFIV